ncbi:MAG: hypothetical protein PG977_001128 [Bartonella clarridgeiae]|nr:MAG: hypothetical protein PG977_001128 [Bartonella clarridgeiae]
MISSFLWNKRKSDFLKNLLTDLDELSFVTVAEKLLVLS